MTTSRPHLDRRHPDCVQEMRAFGATVRQLRMERGLSQERLAELTAATANRRANGAAAAALLTYNRQSVNRVENGTYTPGVHRIFQLAAALGVHPAVLVGGRAPEDSEETPDG